MVVQFYDIPNWFIVFGAVASACGLGLALRWLSRAKRGDDGGESQR
jgi:hypothetical protein